MSAKPVVTVVGSFAVGITIRAPRFPVAGETLVGSDFDMGPGGKGSNQAVGAARLGADVHLVAKIGQDELGEIATKLYQQEGVHTHHVMRVQTAPTGVGVITLNAAGDNHIIIDLGANLQLGPEDVDAAQQVIEQSDVVATVLEIPLATAARAMELAQQHDRIALLNPAPAQPLPDALLAHVDVLTPNESELRILLGLAPDDPADTQTLARELQTRGVRNLVVTQGARGVLVIESSGEVTELPGVPVDVVDSTGAGDAFACALAVALAEGQPLVHAARFATYCGALACTELGVIPGLPTRSAVEALQQS